MMQQTISPLSLVQLHILPGIILELNIDLSGFLDSLSTRYLCELRLLSSDADQIDILSELPTFPVVFLIHDGSNVGAFRMLRVDRFEVESDNSITLSFCFRQFVVL